MSKYVKFNCNTSLFDIADLTSGKVYVVIDGTEQIFDDVEYRIEIMTPNWDATCAHLAHEFKWVWCDEFGVEL
ncbi:hypothetical protein NVP1248O_45 [Vibrio phage 1.248.O._10N.261.54.F1]|nr:hypothetical protein NVP1248O_45 [Vibrio phage 1.248.O._10N.261.54.F1]